MSSDFRICRTVAGFSLPGHFSVWRLQGFSIDLSLPRTYSFIWILLAKWTLHTEMFFECHRLFALFLILKRMVMLVVVMVKGLGVLRVFKNTRVKVKLLMSMYWCSPLRETAVCVFISANI